MAPPPSSFSTDHHPRRCSKAQMCFFNILHIISHFPTDDDLAHNNNICEKKAFGIDLNIGCLGQLSETADVDDVRVNYENSSNSLEVKVEDETVTVHTEDSVISHVGDQSPGTEYNETSLQHLETKHKPKDEGGYLGLLIEAAELIESKSKRPKSKNVEVLGATPVRGKKRKLQQQCWTTVAADQGEWNAEFEDTSPVVRSKRGRNQVLPFRYRDSVVEPLGRWTTSSRCESIGNSNSTRIVSSKRFSK